MAHLEFFSEERIELSKEVQYHPDLVLLLAHHNVKDFEVMLAEVAAYCEVILDGAYTPEDIDKICYRLWKILRKKREIAVN